MTTPPDRAGLLRDRITKVIDRPAGRGKYVEHFLDEGHLPDEPCDICAALAATGDSEGPEELAGQDWPAGREDGMS